MTKIPDEAISASGEESAVARKKATGSASGLQLRAFRSVPLVFACGAAMAGVALGSLLDSRAIVFLWLGASVALVLCGIAVAVERRTLASWCMLTGIALFGAGYHLLRTPPAGDELAAIAGDDWQPLVFRATVTSAAVWRPNPLHRPENPDSQPWRTQWLVRVTQLRDGRAWRSVDGRSTLSVDGHIDGILPGDAVEVFGFCTRIGAPSNPGEPDMRLYYRHEHQFVLLRAETAQQIRVRERSWKMPLLRCLGMLTVHIDRVVHRWVVCGQAALAAALVFGQRQQVDWEDQQDLLATGTLHMLSISGMHVEMVALSIMIACLFANIPTRVMLVTISLVVVFYALIAGANPPVIRATLLVLCACLARWIGRRTRLANLLACAGLTILIIRTSWLANVGVQLSFLAVATIAIFAVDRSHAADRRHGLRAVIEESLTVYQRQLLQLRRVAVDLLRISAWVWLLTAPLIWFHFHVVSPIAVPLNVILWPFLLVGLLSGLVLVFVAWLPPLAAAVGWLCGVSLWCISGIVNWSEKLPLAYFWMPSPPLWWLIAFYCGTFAWLIFVGRRPKALRVLAVILVAWIGLAMAPWIVGQRGQGPSWARRWDDQPRGDRAGELRCTFIDVGHGTSVIVELPSGEVALYDAGHLGSAERSHQEIAGALWHCPTARVHRLFISHADADHYNAVPGLLKRFAIDSVVAPPQFWRHSAKELVEIRALIDAESVSKATVSRGDTMQFDQVTLKALHPEAQWQGESDNSASLCLLISYAGKRILLPGDLEGSGQQELIRSHPVQCDVLMAPHHGSLSQDCRPVIEWCKPAYIVISGSMRAVRPAVIEQFSGPDRNLSITHRDGAIQFRVSDAGELSKWLWREGTWRQEID